MPEWLKEIWGLLAALVGAVLWFARLEARALSNSAEIAHLQKQRHEDLERQKTHRDEMAKTLAEMRTDIKTLLQRQN